MQSAEILSAWKRMLRSVAEEGTESAGFLTEATGTTLSAGAVRLGVSSEHQSAMLIPASRTDKIDEAQKSAFISLSKVSLVVDGSRAEFINVSCDEPELIEVFAKVVGDILQRIELGRSSMTAIDEALREFRRLLRLPSAKAPDITVVAGLVGELIVLIELLEQDGRAWSGWHGPASDRHDFRAGGVSVEVKASLGADGRKVHIHGIKQLEDSPDSTLILKQVRLEPDPAGNLNVPELARRAMQLASEPESVQAKLLDLGFSEAVAEGWGYHTFRKFDETAYQVSEEFPRLVPDLLNRPWPLAGVSEVSYELDLGAASDFALSEDEWIQAVREYCACL